VSLALRAAVRAFLQWAEDAVEGPLQPGSPAHTLRAALLEAEQTDTEPWTPPPDARLRIAALAQAVGAFRKRGSVHFVGCQAEKTGGLCSAACRAAQLALDPDTAKHGPELLQDLTTTLANLDDERRSLQHGVARERKYWLRKMRQVRVETGYQVRQRPGRPKGRAASTANTPDPGDLPSTPPASPTRTSRPAMRA
jgi:hypothetical protein